MKIRMIKVTQELQECQIHKQLTPPPPKKVSVTPWGGGGVVLLRILDWGGCAARFSKSWPYFTPKDVIFHTRFQP